MKILCEKCDIATDNNKELPNSAFVIEYMKEGTLCYDIAFATKQVEIFDHYYDLYKKDFVRMYPSQGRANPKLFSIK